MNISKLILILVFSASVPTFAMDSAGFGPPDTNAIGQEGYVLDSGSIQTYCNSSSGGNWGNCTFTAASRQCRSGYSVKFMVSETRNNYAGSCALRGYMISPSIYANGSGGYDVTFSDAYANFVSCEDRNITLNYSVYCVR